MTQVKIIINRKSFSPQLANQSNNGEKNVEAHDAPVRAKCRPTAEHGQSR
jgi:hypothetical protein